MLIGPINFNIAKTILTSPHIEGVCGVTVNRCDFACASTTCCANCQLTATPPPPTLQILSVLFTIVLYTTALIFAVDSGCILLLPRFFRLSILCNKLYEGKKIIRKMSVSSTSDCSESHRLCFFSVGWVDASSIRNRSNPLSSQTWDVF